MTSEKLALTAAEILDNKGALDIQVIKVDHMTSITDYFVIATGRNTTAVHALADELMLKMPDEAVLRRNEGLREGRWAVLDYAEIIVHIFHPDEREYYNIERLWLDGDNSIPFLTIEEKAKTEETKHE